MIQCDCGCKCDSNVIKPAKRSPRLQGQVFKWFEGDAFTIEWTIELFEDEQPLPYDDDDTLEFNFFDMHRNLIQSFSFDHIQDNTVDLIFTEEISNKFKAGLYTYCVKYINNEGEVITIFANNKVEVQRCH